MIVNSAREFRLWKTKDESNCDVDAMGYRYNGKTGFFKHYHGEKEDISTYLPSLLDIAEDTQSIYEFLQNAVDCESTHFWAFYNDKYFLAVNNGDQFDLSGIRTILNIAQSNKKDSTSIGRLGIGFKIVHRLVGKHEGTRELVEDYKGPLLFSWGKEAHFGNFLSEDTIELKGLDENNPFLFKIAITNFPADVGEIVHDIRGNDRVIFEEDELVQFRKYAAECLGKLFADNPGVFAHGSAFFIDLGEGKKNLLDADLETIRTGMEYSMNTLKQLECIYINNIQVSRCDLHMYSWSIHQNTEEFAQIDPQYQNSDILCAFGFPKLSFIASDEQLIQGMIQSPTYYKYFPMGDEVNSSALFIHSDSFRVEANRRKMHDTPTNRMLLRSFYCKIAEIVRTLQESDHSAYLMLFVSLLFTDGPNAKDKLWHQKCIYGPIRELIKRYLPVVGGGCAGAEDTVICQGNMQLPLEKIGIASKKWFWWRDCDSCAETKYIIERAKNTLNLMSWSLETQIEHSDVQVFNDWLCSSEGRTTTDILLSEIDRFDSGSNSLRKQVAKLRLIKGKTSCFSVSDVFDKSKKVCILPEKCSGLRAVLETLSYDVASEYYENHPYIKFCTHDKYEELLFSQLTDNFEKRAGEIPSEMKPAVIVALSKLRGASHGDVSAISIFSGASGKFMPLGELLPYTKGEKSYLKPYSVIPEEYSESIDVYCLRDAFESIIKKQYKSLILSGVRIPELYDDFRGKWTAAFTGELLEEYGPIYDILKVIEARLERRTFEMFMRLINRLDLDPSNTYSQGTFEYDCVKLSCDFEYSALTDKIYINGIPLKQCPPADDFRSADGKSLSLSELLNGDRVIADYSAVASQFRKADPKGYIFRVGKVNGGDLFRYVLSQKNKVPHETTPAEFAFCLMLCCEKSAFDNDIVHKNLNELDNVGKLVRIETSSQVVSCIDYFYHKGWGDLLQHSIFENPRLTPALHQLKNKFFFCGDLVLDYEKGPSYIEEWCLNSGASGAAASIPNSEKLAYLKKLGFKMSHSKEISLRRKFREGTLDSFDGRTANGMDFIKWAIAEAPFNEEKQLKVFEEAVKSEGLSKRISVGLSKNATSHAREMAGRSYEDWQSATGMSVYISSEELLQTLVWSSIEEPGKQIVLGNRKGGTYQYNADKKLLCIYDLKNNPINSLLAICDKKIPELKMDFSYEDVYLIAEPCEAKRIYDLASKKFSPESANKFAANTALWNLDSDATYPDSSLRHRVIQLFSGFDNQWASKVLVNSITIDSVHLNEYLTGSSYTLVRGNLSLNMQINELLGFDPKIRAYCKIKEMFASADPKGTVFADGFCPSNFEDDALDKLSKRFSGNVEIDHPCQFAFVHVLGCSSITSRMRIEKTESMAKVIVYFYENGLLEYLQSAIKNASDSQPCLSKVYGAVLHEACVRDGEFFIGSEIEDWCGDDAAKLQFLNCLGVITDKSRYDTSIDKSATQAADVRNEQNREDDDGQIFVIEESVEKTPEGNSELNTRADEKRKKLDFNSLWGDWIDSEEHKDDDDAESVFGIGENVSAKRKAKATSVNSKEYGSAPGELSREEQITIHDADALRAKSYLASLGNVRVRGSENGYFTFFLDNSPAIHLLSAKGGNLFLSPNIWNCIVNQHEWILVCTGDADSDFQMLRSEDELLELAQGKILMLAKGSKHYLKQELRTVFEGKEYGEYGSNSMRAVIGVNPSGNFGKSAIDEMFDIDRSNDFSV